MYMYTYLCEYVWAWLGVWFDSSEKHGTNNHGNRHRHRHPHHHKLSFNDRMSRVRVQVVFNGSHKCDWNTERDDVCAWMCVVHGVWCVCVVSKWQNGKHRPLPNEHNNTLLANADERAKKMNTVVVGVAVVIWERIWCRWWVSFEMFLAFPSYPLAPTQHIWVLAFSLSLSGNSISNVL